MPFTCWQQHKIQFQQDSIPSPAIDIIKDIFLLSQIISFLPLLSLTVLPDCFNQIMNIADMSPLFLWWTTSFSLLQVVLCCLCMRYQRCLPIGLLITLDNMIFRIVGNNHMQLVTSLARCLEQILYQQRVQGSL